MRRWRTLARSVLLSRPPWLEVTAERVELHDGTVVEDFLQLRTRDFVMVVAWTEDDRALLVRSYKHGVRRVSLALPAGYIEPDEAAADAAKRELLEETGYAAAAWTPLGSYVVDGNYGMGTEHVFLARGARKVQEPDSGDLEEIELVLVTRGALVAALRSGEVAQLASAAAIALALALEP